MIDDNNPAKKKKDDDDNNPFRKNWMFTMGIMFIVMAAIIAVRNLYFVTTQLSLEFYVDNYFNNELNNEKFVIGMTIFGGLLMFFGKRGKKRFSNPESLR